MADAVSLDSHRGLLILLCGDFDTFFIVLGIDFGRLNKNISLLWCD